jgi:hypothetical protein
MPTMRALPVFKLVLLAFTLALGAGCRFGIGNDYAVTVTWLINGTAPNRDLCKAMGVEAIRFTVLGPGKERTLHGNCDDQVLLEADSYYYGGFVSTRSFEYDVSYRYRVEMLDAQGKLVENATYTDHFEVSWGDDEPRVLVPLELFSPTGKLAGVSGEWKIEGHAPSASDCQRLGAESVAIDFASSTDQYFDDAVEIVRADCAAGKVISDGAVLEQGEYNVRYVALDKDGKVVADVIADQLYVVDTRGTLDIETVDFDL